MYARRGLLALIVLAALVRVAAVAAFPPGLSVYSDMAAYDRLAARLLSAPPRPMDTLYAPGYPAFLALLYAVFGRRFLIVGFVQAILGAATCWLAADIARRWGGSIRIALVTAAVLALYPPLVYYNTLLLTESVAPFAWTLAVWLLVVAGERDGERGWVCAGLALGVAALVRSNLLLWIPCAALLAGAIRGGPLHRRIRAGVCLVVAALALAGFAAARTSVTLGRLAGPSTNGGVNFFMLQADVRGVRTPERTYVPVRNAFEYAELYDAPVPLYDERYFYRAGVDWFVRRSDKLSHVLSALGEGMGLGRQGYWPAEGPEVARATGPRAAAVAVLRFACRSWTWLIVLPLVGLAVARTAGGHLKGTDPALFVGLTCLGLHAFTSAVFLADPRMHVPFDPVLIAALAARVPRPAIDRTPPDDVEPRVPV